MNIGEFLKGILLLGLVAGLISLFIAGLYSNYSSSIIDYNASEYEYSELASIQANLNQTKNSIDALNSPTSDIFDKFSGFIGGTVGALKTLMSSVDVSYGMLDKGVEHARLGESGLLLKLTLGAIILLGLIGAAIAAYLKIPEP